MYHTRGDPGTVNTHCVHEACAIFESSIIVIVIIIVLYRNHSLKNTYHSRQIMLAKRYNTHMHAYIYTHIYVCLLVD